ncbi:hypothetical protein ACETK8_15040 [Brevundimonas staleyi]|uniref:Uncharacterized protein n=1 Tax=Brevundimonas staleyi TaxID=74326 RepID=A0ABW0FZ56_9CAUL
MTIRERIEHSLSDEPGQTASDLATLLFDDGRATSRLQFPLAVLLSRGRIRREGDGGLRDPHRYFLEDDGTSAQRSRLSFRVDEAA